MSMHLVTFYLVFAGSLTATTQAARGVIRGVGKLIEGQPRAALGEVAGGLLAPAKSAYTQVCRLGEDVCRTVSALSADDEEQEALSRPEAPRRPMIVHPIGDAVSG
jgi:hypothetical protein